MDEEYIRMREKFQERKHQLIELAESHEDNAREYRRMIDSKRPKTERGEYVCPQPECDCISMAPISFRTEKLTYEGKPRTDKFIEYLCEICGYSEEKVVILKEK